jgi:hypothetical protein
MPQILPLLLFLSPCLSFSPSLSLFLSLTHTIVTLGLLLPLSLFCSVLLLLILSSSYLLTISLFLRKANS